MRGLITQGKSVLVGSVTHREVKCWTNESFMPKRASERAIDERQRERERARERESDRERERSWFFGAKLETLGLEEGRRAKNFERLVRPNV